MESYQESIELVMLLSVIVVLVAIFLKVYDFFSALMKDLSAWRRRR